VIVGVGVTVVAEKTATGCISTPRKELPIVDVNSAGLEAVVVALTINQSLYKKKNTAR